MVISTIALSAVVVSNVCASLGFGIVGVIPHKKNVVFMLASNMMILALSLVSSMLYYILYNFVLVPIGSTELSLFIMANIVLLLDFVAMCILKAVSIESFYHYEKNFMFVVHAVVVLGMVFASNVALNFVTYIFSIGMQFVGLFAVNILFFSLNHKVNNKVLPEHVRALPPQLAVMSVVSLICYLVTYLAM